MSQVLVPDWRAAWKWVSIHFAVALIVLNAWDKAGMLPAWAHTGLDYINIALATGVLGGRVINQGGAEPQGVKP